VTPRFLPFALCALALLAPPAGADPLDEAFRNPPDATKPWNYWYWMAGNLSEAGITKDLEAMAAAGIGAVALGDINDGPAGPVRSLSPEWWHLVRHAAKECRRTGVAFGMFNSPGWSQSGGPWVKPEESMRALFVSETPVSGRFSGTLAAPTTPFQDLALLAFPLPEGTRANATERSPKVTPSKPTPNAGHLLDGKLSTAVSVQASPKAPFTFDVTLASPLTARAFRLHPAAACNLVGTLEAADASGTFRALAQFDFRRSRPKAQVGFMPLGPAVLSLPETTSDRWRLRLTASATLAEMELSAAPTLTALVEKQFGKMETAYTAWPHRPTSRYPASTGADSPAIPLRSIVNLSGSMRPDGSLDWTPPPGHWMLARVGLGPTGVTNTPATPDATGPEVDKMHRVPLRRHFEAYVGKLRESLPPDDRKAFQFVIADSWEVGGQNWTDGHAELFKQRLGYDPIPWLPVLAGHVVESIDRSERFLFDLRRLAADRMSSEYAGGLKELCREQGMTLWLENYGHWGFAGDALQYGGAADRIGSEFWYRPTGYGFQSEQNVAISAAHLYGKPIVSAEAFTSGDGVKSGFGTVPSDYKRLGDWAFAEGVNHFVLHLYIQQPDDRKPGVNAWFAEMFNRNNTWYPMMPGPVGYWRRACALLQRGWRVADLAYFIGDDVPSFHAERTPPTPRGFSAIDINSEALIDHVTYRDGRYTLPHGASFRLLVLPEHRKIRPETLRKIRDLVRQGAPLLGEPPSASPSLQNYPQCDEEIRALAAELWPASSAGTPSESACGKGRVFRGHSAEQALAALGAQPQLAWPGEAPLVWTQRADGDTRLFFVANQSDQPLEIAPSFDVAGKVPELFQADDASVAPAPAWTSADGRTTVPLRLEPFRSVFVVFRKPGAPPAQPAATPDPAVAADLAGPWRVTFAPGRGAPAETTFDRPILWNEHPEPAIQHFSGIATYHITCKAPDGPGRIALDLGTLHGIAEIRVNGTHAGYAWTPPYRTEITRHLVPGANRLEIRVANAWHNAIVGDAKYPEGIPGATGPFEKTWANKTPQLKADAPLKPSGIAGPVRLLKLP
jgi:hypothetical protein